MRNPVRPILVVMMIVCGAGVGYSADPLSEPGAAPAMEPVNTVAGSGSHVVAQPYRNGVIKGDATRYFGEDLRQNYKILAIKAFAYDSWAGKGFLYKENRNLAQAVDKMIQKMPDIAQSYGRAFCESVLRTNGLRQGLYLVDHFDIQVLETKNDVKIIYTGNMICLIAKEKETGVSRTREPQ